MGKIAVLVLLGVIGWLLWRALYGGPRGGQSGTGATSDSSSESQSPGSSGAGRGRVADADTDARRLPERIVQCAVCGVHLPDSEAVYGRGRIYCSAAHRDADADAADQRGERRDGDGRSADVPDDRKPR